jgi:hypothetical protein
LNLPIPKRSDESISTSSQPMACKTYEPAAEPELHADPEETAISFSKDFSNE